MKYNIGFIGAGNMAFALLKAFKKANLVKSLIASDVNKERRDFVRKEAKIMVTSDNKEVAAKSDIIFLSVKPQVINDVLFEIRDINKLVISIAAGVKLSRLE